VIRANLDLLANPSAKGRDEPSLQGQSTIHTSLRWGRDTFYLQLIEILKCEIGCLSGPVELFAFFLKLEYALGNSAPVSPIKVFKLNQYLGGTHNRKNLSQTKCSKQEWP
jgi:hypothetical protein